MNLIVLWKENINNQLSIIDFKDRLEGSLFEERWLKNLRLKINEKNLSNKKELLSYLDELDLIKKAFKNSLKDFKNETNDILKKYDYCYCSDDEKKLTFKIEEDKKTYILSLEEVFCIDNESIKDRTLAIEKSEEWINKGLVNYDFEIRNNNDIVYATNELLGIDLENIEVNNFLNQLKKDFQTLKDYNEQTIACKKYAEKREIVPEILSRTDGNDSLLKEPSDRAIAAFSAILIEKNMLGLDSIGQYQRKLGRK
jgi:hypothetical protein